MALGKAYAAILGGGSGTRMGNPDKPKQFWDLNGKPVLAHTVEKFCLVDEFEKVIVLVPATWINQTCDIISRFLSPFANRISVVAGGAKRSDTVMCAVSYIEETFGLGEDDVIVTHDAVRPFVSLRIIEENLKVVREYGACDTVVPATDTIVQSVNATSIAWIPDRSEYYQGQTPQSFNIRRLKELYGELDQADEASLTDACKIFVLKGEPVALVRGDEANIKLTYAHDMRIARALMEDGEAHA